MPPPPKPPRRFGWGALGGTAAAAATAGMLSNPNFHVHIDARDTITVTGNTITNLVHTCKPCLPKLRP